MTRASRDEIHGGRVWNGFDYALQVWVRDGVVQPCAHPVRMRTHGPCCTQSQYAGQRILDLPAAEQRDAPSEAEATDPLARIVARRGFLVRGELARLPDSLPVVIALDSGHRARTTAGQAGRFIEFLGDHVAAVFIPADALPALGPHDPASTNCG